MPGEIFVAGTKFVSAAFQSALNGLAKGFTEAKAKQWSETKKKQSSNSSAIVQQTKEQAQWIQAQSEYLKRREERETRLEKLQVEQQKLQAYIAGEQAQREERALELKENELQLQANIAAGQAQREEHALQLKQEELQIQQQDLQERRELARLQRELMRELHAKTVEVKLTEIQTIWDLENWFSKLSRQETEDILRKGQQQYRLLVLASPPDVSEDCPQSFRNNLKIEIQSKLREFLHQNYPLNPGADNFSPCPVEFYGDYFKEPISDIRVKQLQKLLAPVPTVVLYCQISDYEVNFHLGYWGLHDDEVSLLPIQTWDWEQAQEKLEKTGFDEKKSLRIIRQIIVMVHKLLAAFVVDLYYLNLDATASYEPRLFELEKEFAWQWFPQKLVKDYIEMLRQVQQRQRDAYEAEFEKLEAVSWRCTQSFTGFYDDLYRLVDISADGSKLVGERGYGKIMKLWSLRTGKLIRAFDSFGFEGLSKDGQILWRDSPVMPTIVSAPVEDQKIDSLAFSPDRSLLVKPNYNETTETWNLEIIDAATDKLLETLPGHSGSIQQVIFSEDGNTMVSLGGDLVIKVWRRGDG
ncbi:WD40 repeat domain-containing protein [Okeania sp. SIO1I7]|uniref:WD40 repeat domain-containing protein n=1 Tax=Okeania sp. SIO1I7 TaxID=2607772 RepID=UPI0013FA2335|nr:hypothetical protein [Okeania sp. SIO1I7]NET26508.1 hypothetical protein [Okeania sp. SIO1I7]